jgi:hypothetical protein
MTKSHSAFHVWGLLALSTLLLLSPGTTQAQDTTELTRPPPTVEAVMELVRAGEVLWLSSFIRQVPEERSPQELDALSDSLMAYLRNDPDPDSNFRIRRDVIGHIAQAVTPHRGVAFPRGVGLLQEIYQTVDHPDTQSFALNYHAQVAPTGQALVLLRDALGTPDVRAVTAARNLWEEMGQAGIVVLRDAWCDDSIQSPGARRLVRGYSSTGALDCPPEKWETAMRMN